MAKRFKNFRDEAFIDDWEDIRKEDRRKEKQKNKRRQNKRQNRLDEKFRNFKDFRDDYDYE